MRKFGTLTIPLLVAVLISALFTNSASACASISQSDIYQSSSTRNVQVISYDDRAVVVKPAIKGISTSIDPDEACKIAQVLDVARTMRVEWWGETFLVDHCVIEKLSVPAQFAGGIAIVAGALGGTPVWPVAIPLSVATGLFALVSGSLQSADDKCKDKGAYIHITMAVVAWVTPIC